MTSDVRNGRVLNVSQREYLADPCVVPSLSASCAKILATQSPRHAWSSHPRLGGTMRAASAAQENGTLWHQLLLGAGDQVVVVEFDDFRTKAAREAKEQAYAEGKTPVTARKFDEARAIADKVAANIKAAGVVFGDDRETPIEFEQRVFTTDAWITCRSLVDAHDAGEMSIHDLKTCESANPKKLERTIYQYGYDIQHAAHTRALAALRGVHHEEVDMTFVFVETSAPYDVVPVTLSAPYKQLGELRWTRAVSRWHECISRGRHEACWPGHLSLDTRDGRAVLIEPPAYAIADEQMEGGL